MDYVKSIEKINNLKLFANKCYRDAFLLVLRGKSGVHFPPAGGYPLCGILYPALRRHLPPLKEGSVRIRSPRAGRGLPLSQLR